MIEHHHRGHGHLQDPLPHPPERYPEMLPYNQLADPMTRLLMMPALIFLIAWGLHYIVLWGTSIRAEKKFNELAHMRGRRNYREDDAFSADDVSPARSISRFDLTDHREAEAAVETLVDSVRRDSTQSNNKMGATENPALPADNLAHSGIASSNLNQTRLENGGVFIPRGTERTPLLAEANGRHIQNEELADLEKQEMWISKIKNTGDVAAMLFTLSLGLATIAIFCVMGLPAPTRHQDIVGSQTRSVVILVSTWMTLVIGVLWMFGSLTFSFISDERKLRIGASTGLLICVVVFGIALESENRARLQSPWIPPRP